MIIDKLAIIDIVMKKAIYPKFPIQNPPIKLPTSYYIINIDPNNPYSLLKSDITFAQLATYIDHPIQRSDAPNPSIVPVKMNSKYMIVWNNSD